MSIMPYIVSTRDIQRHYRQVFDYAKAHQPVIVLNNNQPDVAIISITDLEDLYRKSEQLEMKEAIKAINAYQKEKKSASLTKLLSLKDLAK